VAGGHLEPSGSPPADQASGGRKSEAATQAAGGHLEPSGSPPADGSSRAACFSFYATKNLPIGEGGMVTTADPDLAGWLRGARLHGMSRDAWRRYLPGSGWRYSVEVDGLKANLTDLQAAIGRAQLRRLAGWQERRRELAERYDKHLAELPGVAAPWRPRPGQGRHAWHLYVLRVGPAYRLGRDALVDQLARRGIDCSVHFIPLHHQPWFRRAWGEALSAGFPAADAASGEVVSLPLYPSLTDGDVDRVCEAIAELGGHARVAR
jgi:perosamine synthetase